ncbi:hypothetical protein AZE42_09410 [Rhizopogon vesiculosus]|uniref:DUF6533 domain-containing protein n=1 Tax=Rhizopogon vesiculosus TaxID=180088 RepID=A0A1J8Q773_9AGAM|nr:hypothetical protein AZE42_09410 [Rhizopogon vesiculosus]
MATFWAYDYACSLDHEWTFLLGTRWTKIKGLYVVTRYVPFLFFIGHLYLNFIPNENPDKCQMLNTVCETYYQSSAPNNIYALGQQQHRALSNAVHLFCESHTLTALQARGRCISQGAIVASIAVVSTTIATAPYETSGIPGITGCYQGTGSFRLFFVPFLLLLAIELGLLCLTLIRAIQSWRTGNALYSVLLKHNIFYYACGPFFSMVNMLITLLLEYAYNALFQNFQIIILAILATRMHLHLWHSERRIHGSALSVIPMSDVSFAGHSITTSII